MNSEIECTPTESTVIPIRDYQPQTDNNVFQAMAVEKIATELKSFTGGQKEKCVSTHVAAEITHFCEESPEFAEVVYKTKRTLSDCCTEVLKGVGNHISDIDVYRGIAKAYFPNADVRFLMNIEINGAAPSKDEMARVPEKPKPSQPKPAPKVAPKPTEKVAAPATPKPAEPEIIQLSLF